MRSGDMNGFIERDMLMLALHTTASAQDTIVRS